VVGSVGLLLGGTLYGINSYLTTVQTTERKLYELQQVNVILHTLTGGERAAPQNLGGYRVFEPIRRQHVTTATTARRRSRPSR